MSELKGNNSTPKISDIFNNKTLESSQSVKRPSSTSSPSDNDPDTKKQNTNACEKNQIADYTQILDPRLTQFKSLRESVNNKVGSLEQAISQQRKEVSEELRKIETSLTQHKAEITHELKSDILDNKQNISHIAEENKHLRRENITLKERLTQIENNQLKNNIIITSIL